MHPYIAASSSVHQKHMALSRRKVDPAEEVGTAWLLNTMLQMKFREGEIRQNEKRAFEGEAQITG